MSVRTYGNWRRRRGFEVMGFPGPQLAALMSAVCVPLMISLVDWDAGLVAMVPGALVAAGVLIRTDGTPTVVRLVKRWVWKRAYRAGMTEYRSVLVTKLPGPKYLPGPLAPVEMLAVRQVDGRLAAWLWDRRTGYLTSQIRLSSTGTLLADPDNANSWVEGWGAWLANLGHTAGVRSVAIIVETAPSQGSKVRDYVVDHLADDAPAVARELMHELLDDMPGQTSEVHQWAAITLDSRRLPAAPTTMPEAVAQASVALAGLADGLNSGGVSVLGRPTPGWTAGRVRAAFDPAMRAQIERDLETEVEVTWQHAGPLAAQEEWGHLKHDSGWSVTYALRDLPAAQVRHDVLRRLMAPGRWPRRVALFYTPYPAQLAASVVDSELNAASVRQTAARKVKRDFSVREQMDSSLAVATAVEQARGAGLGEPGILVTVTVLDEAELASACADLESRARGARLQLIKLFGAQMLGFTATLGVGVDPYDLASRTPGLAK